MGIKELQAKIIRRAVLAGVVATALLMAPFQAIAQQTKRASTTEERYASIVVEASTGRVLSERHADARRYPASLTKMMTLYMVFDALEKGEIKLSDRLPVSQRAAAQQPSKLNLRAGSTIKLEDAVLALVTKSANDVAVVIAEKLGDGSEATFATRMTNKARALGMRNTTFRNASGLPNPQQSTTARDFVTLSRALINDFPGYYRYFSTPQFTYAGVTYRSHNRLMGEYDGMDGIKTGYINASGFNLAASAKRDNVRLIGVVFGGRSAVTRNAHMRELLDAGFEKVRTMPELRNAGTSVPVTTTNVTAVPVTVQQQNRSVGVASQFNGSIPPVAAAPADMVLKPARDLPQPRPNQPQQQPTRDPALLTREPGPGRDTANNAMLPANDGASGLPPQPQPVQGGIQSTPRVVVANTDTGIRYVPGQEPKTFTYETAARIAPQPNPAPLTPTPTQSVQIAAAPSTGNVWAVQVGAFTTREASERALNQALAKLPAQFNTAASRQIAPLATAQGTVYRARLGNLPKESALSACRILRDSCMIMSVN